MANFLDKPIQFNPYIQQLPIEAMTSVGLQRQQQYDEGVQKIQSTIDNIAGMDIVRDVDKAYLQSRLTNLGNNLKGVAAGDFSNYQLVNSVTGLTNQIGKDINIQNAIRSTQTVRKGQQDLEAAKKEGKSSAQNEDYWNTQVYSYLNNRDLKTTFNSSYVPYVDLTEKYNKVAKDIEAVEYSYDMPYVTDERGMPRFFTTDDKGNQVETTREKGGHPIVDDAMKSITRKGKSAQTILANFYDNTTENDKKQLEIDAAYHYKNATADTFKNDIISTYTLKKKQLNDYTTELSVQLKSPKLSDKEKAALQAQLTDINNILSTGKIDEQMERSLQELRNPGDLQSYKTRLYTQKYLTNLAQDRSTESYKEELKSNPYAQMNMEKKKFQFDIQKENVRINQWNTDHQWDVYKWQQERTDKIQETVNKEREKLGGEPITIPGGKTTDVEIPTSLTLTNRLNANTLQLKQLTNNFLSKHPTYKQADLDVLMDRYDRNPGDIDLVDDNSLRKYILNRRSIEHDNIRVGQMQVKLDEATSHIDEQLSSLFNGQGGVTDRNGNELYSAKELYDVAEKIPSLISITNYGVYDKPKLDVDALMQRYTGTKYEPLARAIAKKATKQPLTATENVLATTATNVYNQYHSIVDKTYQVKLEEQSKYLAGTMPEYMTMEGTLSKSNKTDMDHVDQLIADSMNPPAGMMDVTKKSEWNPATITAWREKEAISKNLDYRIIKNYDGSARFIIQHGNEIQSIPLSADYFNRFFPRYAAVSPITKIKSDILSSPGHTTNIMGTKDPVNAAFTGDDIPNLRGTNFASRVRYDIEGDEDNTGAAGDGFQIRVYVCDDKGLWHQGLVNQKGFIGEERIQDAINMIGMDVVEKILKK